MTSRGYYLNSLRAWKADLNKQLRQLMARHARMQGMFHPDTPDQGRLIDLTQHFIRWINDEISAVESDGTKSEAVCPLPGTGTKPDPIRQA